MITSSAIALCTATAITSLGGFSDAPQCFKRLTKYKLFQFLVLCILVHQSNNSGQSGIVGTIMISVSFFLVIEFIHWYEKRSLYLKKGDKLSE